MQAYSDPKREADPHALPDIEIFYIDAREAMRRTPYLGDGQEGQAPEVGFYWQSCSPGCLPDGDAFGPFPTAEEALADAREGVEEL